VKFGTTVTFLKDYHVSKDQHINEGGVPMKYEELRDGRVVLITYPSAFTMAEVSSMTDAVKRAILSKAPKTVHTISDVSAVNKIPANILSLSMGMMKGKPTGIGTIIFVTHNNTLHQFARILIRLFPLQKFAIFSTVAEALEEADRLIALEFTQEKG
jgi:hypothetical protein